VEYAIDGESAQALKASFSPDLIILDLMLPRVSGFDLLRHWRKTDQTTRMIILSARAHENDRVAGLLIGADDYVTKPFSLMELLLRIRKQLVRLPDRQDMTILKLGDSLVDIAAHTVTRNGVTTSLTDKECGVLAELRTAGGAAVTKEKLLRVVWGHKADIDTRTVEVHVAGLRKKIERNPHFPRHLITVHKTGYRLQVNEEGTG
jgi:DNA-binding response OmpR family regulator